MHVAPQISCVGLDYLMWYPLKTTQHSFDLLLFGNKQGNDLEHCKWFCHSEELSTKQPACTVLLPGICVSQKSDVEYMLAQK